METPDTAALFDGLYFAAQDAARAAEKLNAAGYISAELVKLALDQLEQVHALTVCARREAERARRQPSATVLQFRPRPRAANPGAR